MLDMARHIQLPGYGLHKWKSKGMGYSLFGDCVKNFSDHSDAIQSLAVFANGDFLLSILIDGTHEYLRTLNLSNQNSGFA